MILLLRSFAELGIRYRHLATMLSKVIVLNPVTFFLNLDPGNPFDIWKAAILTSNPVGVGGEKTVL